VAIPAPSKDEMNSHQGTFLKGGIGERERSRRGGGFDPRERKGGESGRGPARYLAKGRKICSRAGPRRVATDLEKKHGGGRNRSRSPIAKTSV